MPTTSSSPATFYIPRQSHTLGSALRAVLEEQNPDDLVACTVLHPLDDFMQVLAPSEAALRRALLELKDRIGRTRARVAAA